MRLFQQLSRIVHATWGLSSEIVKILYLRAIEPAITYGCEIWSSVLRYKYICRKLLSVQRLFAIRVAKAYRTISTNGVLALTGLIPLDLKIKELAAIENVKVSRRLPDQPDVSRYQGRIKFYSLRHPSKRLVISHKVAKNITEAEALERVHDTVIYTDGSRIDGRVGAAFVAKSTNLFASIHQKFNLANCCSVFQAELVAIRESLNWLASRPITSAIIFSDSNSALQAIENRCNINPLINQIIELVHRIQDARSSVTFSWVKAHSGIAGNELADFYAKEAALSTNSQVVWTDFPLSFAKHHIRNATLQAWENRYISEPGGKTTKLFFPTFESLKSIWSLKLGFEMTQVLSGHGLFKAYLLDFKLINSNVCPCDSSSIQTSRHILYDCPSTYQTRQTFQTLCDEHRLDPTNLSACLRNEEVAKSFTSLATELVKSTRRLNNQN